MILGLDISTSITGLCVLDASGAIVHSGYIDMRKEKSFFEKVKKAKTVIGTTIKEHNIEEVWIEQSLQAFRPGLSSAKTLLTLAKFNGILSWTIWESGIEPNYVGASTARKSCGIKVPKGEKAKNVVVNFLLDNEPCFEVEYTKFGNVKQHFFDIADAIIVAKAGFTCHTKKS